MNLYEKRQWQIKEAPFRREGIAHTETIFTSGNGLVGVRGTFEEGYPGDQPTVLAAGIFNHAEGQIVPELAGLPNWLSIKFAVNGEEFHMTSGRVIGYERVLDLKTATLSRGVLWLSPNGVILRLLFERFASRANPHIMALRVTAQVLSEGVHTLTVTDALDASGTNPGGVNHWGERKLSVIDSVMCFDGTTNQSGYQVAVRAKTTADLPLDWQGLVDADGLIAAQRSTVVVSYMQKVTFSKIVAVHTTRDTPNPGKSADYTLSGALKFGYDALKNDHDTSWAADWDRLDVIIEGDEIAQLAVRFSTYHVMIAVPTEDERVSIGAKTLSGFGYKGHVFWDTELFMVPQITICTPERAKSLLMYRYHNLHGAREKAREAGYEGAMFPWESTDTGLETTPRWADQLDTTGNRIRIWTGDHEQHISTDIAYAVMQFWNWTSDDAWMARYGAEIVLDTAVFWSSRAEWNEAKGRYELSMQIGPDEYHENVNNSVFTNRMVVWHLQQAKAVWAWLKDRYPEDMVRLAADLKIDGERLTKWDDIIAKMWIPMGDEGLGPVFEQFEGFFERLKPMALHEFSPRTANMDWLLGHAKTQTVRVIKQADVVMLMALLGEQLGDETFLRRNWETYYPVVDHGSSLSPSVHAWVAARLGLVDIAYEMFIFAATIDLEDKKGNVHDGIHAASAGGVWQAVAFGFLGLTLTDSGPILRPNLPAHWKRVRINVVWHGERYALEARN
jgi:trehalose/maltose hydrolase-like predicted phosphorylase